ncbi:MAG: hypothetical protein K8823_511 [Cenarchaeum symbiont of Oopsacas minuta]|nr:hypothetical protein [Cenarchaeum symbiont of Oopsacas minuta]
MKKIFAMFVAIILLAPAYVGAQESSGIVLLDNFGTFSKGDTVFIYGSVGLPIPNSFLILKITNPLGDICQIQQILPLQDGTFVMDRIPLRGNICGLEGTYDVEVFYGEAKNSAVFSISSNVKPIITSAQYSTAADEYVGRIIDEMASTNSAPALESRLATASGELRVALSVFKDVLDYDLSEDVLYDVDTTFRPAIYSFLNAVDDLERSGKITSATKMTLVDDVITSVFYYQIGDKDTAFDIMFRTYTVLTNADPTTDLVANIPYEELEDTLLNLMTKTGSVMSRDVQKEIALIFSRGQGPIYVDELTSMLDLLTKTRFLDVVLLKNDPLYSLLNSKWETERLSLVGKDTVTKLLAESKDVTDLHSAAILLRGLDSVERFIDTPAGTAETNLANLLKPEWDTLKNRLNSITSVEDILDKNVEITSMKNVAEISERISKAMDISQNTGLGVELVDEWNMLLTDVEDARSLQDILSIVSQFNTTLTELREKRNPVAILTFEYKRMEEQAKRQADYANLAMINEAIKILEATTRLSDSGTSASRIDRAELLLTWASEQASIIQADLDAYTDLQFKERAGGILHRANSLEVLVDMSLNNHRFDVGFVDFTDSIKTKISRVQNLVVAERLYEADNMLDDLYDEWQIVLKAYSDDPTTTVGYSLTELKRIEYNELVNLVEDVVNRYADTDFNEHVNDYENIRTSLELSLSLGNFETADGKLRDLLEFVSENLDSSHKSIIYDVEYNPQTNLWSVSGYLDKDNDRRVQINLYVYNSNGEQINSLEFGDTKNGEFGTFWIERMDPGLYVTTLHWQDATSTKVTHVLDPTAYDSTKDDPILVEVTEKYETIKVFIQTFGGSQYVANAGAFAEVQNDIEEAIGDGDSGTISAGTVQLQLLAERYLPQRERAVVIDASYQNDKIHITGAVDKLVEFSEDLYVDIYDENGNILISVAVKDTPTGYIDESVNKRLDSGLYVARIHYHDFMASDFFSVN